MKWCFGVAAASRTKILARHAYRIGTWWEMAIRLLICESVQWTWMRRKRQTMRQSMKIVARAMSSCKKSSHLAKSSLYKWSRFLTWVLWRKIQPLKSLIKLLKTQRKSSTYATIVWRGPLVWLIRRIRLIKKTKILVGRNRNKKSIQSRRMKYYQSFRSMLQSRMLFLLSKAFIPRIFIRK